MNSFYSPDELIKLGFKSIGENVLISKKASIYGAKNISIGSNVRIDDFCLLSGNITLGNYIHISAYTALYGGKVGIIMKDFSGISSRCVVYAVSDDYSGNCLTNPMVPNELRNVIEKQVVIERHVLIGTGTTILPGVILNEGSAIGACSLVIKDCEAWSTYVGTPAKKIKERSKYILELEKQIL